MQIKSKIVLVGLGIVGTAGVAFAQARPVHDVPPSKNGDVVVGLCDGHTSIEVPGLKPGQAMPHDQAQAVSDRLMAEWERKNPGSTWKDEDRAARKAKDEAAPPAQAPVTPGPGSNAGGQRAHTYGAFTDRDEAIWRASTEAFVDQGKKIFHDAGELGGTIGVSCDMCHPNAANTHPETYPKYQVQLGRVALLRDMISWCIENPVRGKPLADADPKLKALEAYILAQRKGTALEYGKH